METVGFQKAVRSAQGGDRSAMDQVLEQLHPYISNLASRYADPMRPAESTSDLLQESCLRAWDKIGSFEGGQGDEETFQMFRAWIGQIVRRLGRNAARDHGRKKRNPGEKILSLDAPLPPAGGKAGGRAPPSARERSPSSFARSGEGAQRIQAALAGLPDPVDAEIMKLHLFEGLKLKEIAGRVELSYDQVRRRYRRTVQILESDLGDLL